MKTRMKKDGDTVIVSMDGKLDFETQVPLREDLQKLIRQSQDSVPLKIIFNLERLDFVGSSGISAFVQTLREFNQSAPVTPRYCNVKSEFQRVIRAFGEEDLFEFYDNEDRARESFDH
jgi:anti-anti-sigma factor